VRRSAAIVVAIVAGLAAASSPAAPPDPRPLAGVPLGAATGLRLLVADTAPFVLDVDTGRTTRVPGVPDSPGVLWVVGVGGRGAVVVQGGSARSTLYGIPGRGSRATRLGLGANAWPAADGRSAWIQAVGDPGRCTLRRVALEGRVLRGLRPFPCATHSDPAGGSLGLVVKRTRVVDPRSGRTVRRTRWGVLAGAGMTLVLAGPGEGITLVDAETGAEKRLSGPDTLRGRGRAAVEPGGRFVALEYADPAWQQTGMQAVDIWLLDTKTAVLRRLPGMPLVVALKFTDMAWTNDGRLVLLGEDDRGGFVAVWRPGEERLAVKRVRLPQRRSGSDSFAILG
jgi:hypothetical protein